ncbi:MAG: hypothetical protein Q7U08_07265 [Flavobacteriaceae bacterium]|nr:hypothetical protein [Flavobacteriaceae bacterium]
MRKVLFFLFLLGFQFSFSQVEAIDEDEIIDELMLSDEYTFQKMIDLLYNYKAVYASVNYTNKTYFAGRELKKLDGTVINQISITPQIFYMSSKGLILGISGLYLSELNPKWDTSVLTAGWGKTIGKKLNMRYETTYSRYIYGKEYENIAKNSLEARFLLFSNNRTIGTEMEVSYIFGENNAFNTSLSIIGNFNIVKLNQKNNLSFQPKFTLYLGQENIELYRLKYNMYRPYIEYYNDKVFDLFYAQLNLPFNLSIKDVDVEMGYNLNFPHKIGSETNLKNTSFYTIAMRYAFDL